MYIIIFPLFFHSLYFQKGGSALSIAHDTRTVTSVSFRSCFDRRPQLWSKDKSVQRRWVHYRLVCHNFSWMIPADLTISLKTSPLGRYLEETSMRNNLILKSRESYSTELKAGAAVGVSQTWHSGEITGNTRKPLAAMDIQHISKPLNQINLLKLVCHGVLTNGHQLLAKSPLRCNTASF